MKNLMIALVALSLAACDPASTPETTASAPADNPADIQQDVTPDGTDHIVPDVNTRDQQITKVLANHGGKWLLTKSGTDLTSLSAVHEQFSMYINIDNTHDCITIGGEGSPYNNEVTIDLPPEISNPLKLVWPDKTGADVLEADATQLIWRVEYTDEDGNKKKGYRLYTRPIDE